MASKQMVQRNLLCFFIFGCMAVAVSSCQSVPNYAALLQTHHQCLDQATAKLQQNAAGKRLADRTLIGLKNSFGKAAQFIASIDKSRLKKLVHDKGKLTVAERDSLSLFVKMEQTCWRSSYQLAFSMDGIDNRVSLIQPWEQRWQSIYHQLLYGDVEVGLANRAMAETGVWFAEQYALARRLDAEEQIQEQRRRELAILLLGAAIGYYSGTPAYTPPKTCFFLSNIWTCP